MKNKFHIKMKQLILQIEILHLSFIQNFDLFSKDKCIYK